MRQRLLFFLLILGLFISNPVQSVANTDYQDEFEHYQPPNVEVDEVIIPDLEIELEVLSNTDLENPRIDYKVIVQDRQKLLNQKMLIRYHPRSQNNNLIKSIPEFDSNNLIPAFNQLE